MDKVLWGIGLTIFSFAMGFVLCKVIQSRKKSESVSASFLLSKLSTCSELTTCQMEYANLIKYENGSIPLFTKRSFSMIYQARIRSGIDLSKAEIKIDGKKVMVYLPNAEIQSMEIDTDTLRFYDEHFALFVWNDKEDISSAISLAKKDAMNEADLKELNDTANAQAVRVVERFLEPFISKNMTLEVHS